MDCGENVDAGLLRLPGTQLELLRRLKAAGKPVVTVLIGGPMRWRRRTLSPMPFCALSIRA